MTKKFFPMLALLALVLTTLACGALSNLGKDVKDAQATVEAAQTDASDNGNDAEPTAKPTRTPKPTKESNTDQPTAEPEATASDGGDNSVALDNVPDDIPMLPEEDIENLVSMQGIVSYQTDVAFKDVVDFYQEEMPNQDWAADDSTTILMSDTAILSYTKDKQTALVTIAVDPASQATTITIIVADK